MTHKNPKTDRAVAISILSEVLETNAFANVALRRNFAEVNLDPRERAFVTDLVNETLRNLLQIDHLLNKISRTPVEKMKPFIRNLLRISVCQIKFMDKIPDSAAVNEAVKLTRIYGFHNLANYVNGVLRNVAREELNNDFLPYTLKFSYPKWLMDKLVDWLGKEGALNFCESSHIPPPVTVLTNTAKTDIANLAKQFEAEEVSAIPLDGAHPFFILRKIGDMTRLNSFKDGLFYVVDPGVIHAIDAVNAQPGQTILDLCAAPGGKTFAMAAAMKNEGKLLAYDVHPHRVELIRQTQKRLGLPIISATLGDAAVLNPDLENIADAVLLDVPCSGLGTIRKHPEMKYTRQPQDITDLAKKQQEMLCIAAKYVKPGGKLVYCTCTVAEEENGDNICFFLQTHENYSLVQARQIMPGTTNDGFYVAEMKRER